ncbi:hypothetical protein [Lysinibacillus sp. NPDC047702]|uniref:hypothetical protein n=1 Tax=unclassified Lysinibacillus TaxID=2636778 RepID=UPI003CFBDBF7
MQFIKKYGFLIFTMVITLVGFFVLKFSVDLGAGAASAYLDSMGGSMDSAEFNSIQSKYIIANMIAGGILLFLGLTFLFFSVYRLSKNNS